MPTTQPTLPLLPSQNGVVFDQHFTDSLCRLALGARTYQTHVSLARSVPRKEVLLSLLLFDKAYIVEPFWLMDDAAGYLEPLFSEGLIDLVPEAAQRDAFAALGRIIDKVSLHQSITSAPSFVSLDNVTGKLRNGTCQPG